MQSEYNFNEFETQEGSNLKDCNNTTQIFDQNTNCTPKMQSEYNFNEFETQEDSNLQECNITTQIFDQNTCTPKIQLESSFYNQNVDLKDQVKSCTPKSQTFNSEDNKVLNDCQSQKFTDLFPANKLLEENVVIKTTKKSKNNLKGRNLNQLSAKSKKNITPKAKLVNIVRKESLIL